MHVVGGRLMHESQVSWSQWHTDLLNCPNPAYFLLVTPPPKKKICYVTVIQKWNMLNNNQHNQFSLHRNSRHGPQGRKCQTRRRFILPIWQKKNKKQSVHFIFLPSGCDVYSTQMVIANILTDVCRRHGGAGGEGGISKRSWVILRSNSTWPVPSLEDMDHHHMLTHRRHLPVSCRHPWGGTGRSCQKVRWPMSTFIHLTARSPSCLHSSSHLSCISHSSFSLTPRMSHHLLTPTYCHQFPSGWVTQHFLHHRLSCSSVAHAVRHILSTEDSALWFIICSPHPPPPSPHPSPSLSESSYLLYWQEDNNL